MLGIGGAEMAMVAVVALVVIGPERLPGVMGQIGRWYRQLRTMSNELLAEARAQWEEGMKEVEGVTNTINTAWSDATTITEPVLPPPPVRQVPFPLVHAKTAADAGPFILPAWHNAPSPEVEPLGEAVRTSAAPTMLPRRVPEPYDPATDDMIGGPSLMGPAATEEELAAAAYELPPDDASPVPSTNGAAHPEAPGEEETPESIRERTIVDLYLNGGITADRAAAFLGVTPDEFKQWADFARATRSRS
ncbi:MAG TPA: hypothetical protein VFN74_24750 [Chloroflexota bacterium]|nr:hypothetical protein [Chloroflexota bacterium]